MQMPILTISGKEKGKIELPQVFDTKISPTLLHEIVVGHLSNQRSGTHFTKTRGEVSGGGAKPWKQKGTGNARAGSNRSPLWRKGGIIFGPRPRDYYQNISQQKRKLSVKMVLSSKLKSGDIIVLDEMKLEEAKTKKMAEILKNLKVNGKKALFVVEKSDEKLKRAMRNLPNVALKEVRNISAYELLWAHKIVFTSGAIEELKKI